jgi:hypothetical protein
LGLLFTRQLYHNEREKSRDFNGIIAVKESGVLKCETKIADF